MLVAANFGETPVEVKLEYPVKQIVLSNREGVSEGSRPKPESVLELNSCEVIVLECE